MTEAVSKFPTELRTRDIQLDVLRTLGLLCIVLAHTGPPRWLQQLRSFDVPLMVIVSGAACALSSSACLPFIEYLKGRALRLLVPVWAFLIIYFLITYLTGSLAGTPFPYSFQVVAESFCLLPGIGYLWIVRVFVLVAVFAPLLQSLDRKIASHLAYFAVLLIVYCVYEVMLVVYARCGYPIPSVRDYLLYAIPYSCLFGVGLRLAKLRTRLLYWLTTVAFLVLLAFLALRGIDWSSFDLADYKYPPTTYYIFYGVAMSLLLYCLTAGRFRIKTRSNSVLTFFASSTLWIYLWHILILRLWNWYPSLRPSLLQSFWGKWTVLLLVSTIITYVQKHAIRAILNRIPLGAQPKSMLKTAFLR